MEPWNVNTFWNTLRNDIWVMKNTLDLPETPLTPKEASYDEKTDITTLSVKHTGNIVMDAKREAGQAHRQALAPIVFILTQKLYAEIFRLVLGENNTGAGKNQIDIEEKINLALKQPASFVVAPVFRNWEEFEDWWQGSFKYKEFREARNQMVHNSYYFDGDLLIVKNKQDMTVLEWTVDEVFRFAKRVLEKIKQTSTMWALPTEEREG